MKRLYFQHMILSGTLVLALGACGHKPSKALTEDRSFTATSPPPQHLTLLQEARTESENLRGELSSLKIQMAKQMGELQSWREQSQSVHQREQTQGQELQNIRSELLSFQAERDQLRKHNMELQGQVSSLPDTSQLVSDLQSLRGSFQQIISSMKSLASDMTLIKKEMRITTNKAKPQQTKLSNTLPTVTNTDKPIPDARGRIVIQEGDTLWKLSRIYQVPVEQLREWNHITSDLILTGFRLQVAEPMDTVVIQPNQDVPTTQATAVSDPKHVSNGSPAPTSPKQTTDIHENTDMTPTHILSIARPQSDSPESP
ncbi:MAG: LysM peptidoglycan-binding domain-containing protein [Nitrospirota bacterium]|nr:LysM peptidoglycan-binding domain-containing protein [Nitrospirota bacterium]